MTTIVAKSHILVREDTMKNILKRFGFLVTLIGVFIGVAGFAPASAATGDGGATFTVTSISHGVPTASTTLSNTQEGLIGGATQMLWQDANFNGHLTVANVKQAYKYRIRVIATGANSSQVIYQRSHHRKEVVLLPRSKVRNTGLHNHIRGGFVWTTGLEVIKYDKPSHQYRHAASLLTDAQFAQVRQQNPSKVFKVVGRVKLGHKVYNIVVWCGNYIGGNVVMFPTIVQVASVEDLVMESDATSVAKALVTVDFNVQCPNNGASFNATGYAYASASASSHIRYTQRTKLREVSAVEDKAKQQISIDQSVTADAQASITVSSDCGTPPPPPNNAPAASASADVCTTPGGIAPNTIVVTGKNNDSVTRDLEFSLSGPTSVSPVTKSVGSGASVQVTFTGLALGNYTYSVMVKDTGKSDSGSVSLQPCPTPTLVLSLDKPNDLDQSVAAPGQPIDWSFTPTYGHVTAPTGAGNVIYTVGATYGSVKFVTPDSPCAQQGLRNNVVTTITMPSGTYDLALCYIASTEDPATYGGSDTITLTAVFAGKTYTDSKSITINPTPQPPM